MDDVSLKKKKEELKGVLIEKSNIEKKIDNLKGNNKELKDSETKIEETIDNLERRKTCALNYKEKLVEIISRGISMGILLPIFISLILFGAFGAILPFETAKLLGFSTLLLSCAVASPLSFKGYFKTKNYLKKNNIEKLDRNIEYNKKVLSNKRNRIILNIDIINELEKENKKLDLIADRLFIELTKDEKTKDLIVEYLNKVGAKTEVEQEILEEEKVKIKTK